MTYYLGIDIGAARTSAAVARAGSDDVEPVDLGDGGCGVASVLHLGAGGDLDVGEAAERYADDEPDRVVRGFPGRIGDDVPMLLAGEPWAPEELTAWLVRWVVDRVAEREGGPAGAVAVTRPATWDADRTDLLAGALAEQDLDAAFLTTARAAEWHPDGASEIASAAACGAALALRAGATSDGDAGRLAASAHLSERPDDRPASAPDDGPAADVPAPRSHRSGGWPASDHAESGPESSGAHRSAGDPVDGSGAHRSAGDPVDGSGAHRSAGDPVDGSGAHRSAGDPIDGSGAHRSPGDPIDGSGAHRSAGTDHEHDALLAALGGFTGTLGATNTAGLLSGYTPPSGLPLSGQATALVTDSAQVALPTQRSGSGRWAAVPDLAEADELEPAAAPVRERERSPAALVSIGGAAAAVAVVASLFLWPAPRATNSAVSRPVPLVPAVTTPAAPTAEPTLTPTPTTTRPRPAPTRTRRPAAPPPAVETTPAPTEPTEPTEVPTSSEQPPSESVVPTTTEEQDDDD